MHLLGTRGSDFLPLGAALHTRATTLMRASHALRRLAGQGAEAVGQAPAVQWRDAAGRSAAAAAAAGGGRGCSAAAAAEPSARTGSSSSSSDPHQRLLDAALPHVHKRGWSEAALRAGARDLGLSPAAAGLLGSEAEFVQAFVARCNEQLEAQLAGMRGQLAQV